MLAALAIAVVGDWFSLRTPQAVKHFFAECSKIRLRESNGIEKLFDALVLPFDVVHLVVEVDADELIYIISPTTGGDIILQTLTPCTVPLFPSSSV